MKKILVPTDFTSVADVAIHYACSLSKSLQSEVQLLHVVKKASEIEEANQKLEAQAARHRAESNYDLKYTTKVGNIFDDIAAVAKEEKAELVVMGTHGLQGLQYLVGSNALRVVAENSAPMIIVQGKAKTDATVKKLLLPLDLHKDTKQKLKTAVEIAKRYNSEVHIIAPKESDEFLHNQIARNVSYAEGFMEQNKIAYKTKFTAASSSGFVKELLMYAAHAEIDLICILNNTDEQLIHAFGIDNEQKIITNESQIPVMILNPASTYIDDRSIFSQ